MTTVRVIVEDIEGHGISAAVDPAGVIWVVMSPHLRRPYVAFAELMTELVGCLPDVCTYEVSRAAPPANLQLAS